MNIKYFIKKIEETKKTNISDGNLKEIVSGIEEHLSLGFINKLLAKLLVDGHFTSEEWKNLIFELKSEAIRMHDMSLKRNSSRR